MKQTKEEIINRLKNTIEFCIKRQEKTISEENRSDEYFFYGGYKHALITVIEIIEKELE